MPSKKAQEEPKDYREANAYVAKARDRNSCAPVAVALVTGTEIGKVLKLFEEHGRKKDKGTPRSITEGVLETLGFTPIKLSTKLTQESIFARFPKAHRAKTAANTYHPKRFPDCFDHLPAKMLLFVDAHVSAWVDGEVKDWTCNKSCRIKTFWEIRKSG